MEELKKEYIIDGSQLRLAAHAMEQGDLFRAIEIIDNVREKIIETLIGEQE